MADDVNHARRRGRPPRQPSPVVAPPPVDVAKPDERSAPQRRMDELKRKGVQHLGEGETIELRRLEDLLRDEARVAVLEGMDRRVEEEDDELRMLRQRVTEARAAGGFE